MSLPNKYLKVKTSTLPNSGNGLFVMTDVTKGSLITEYLGKKTTWSKVENDVDNGYIYYIDEDNVIDAAKSLKTFGRYANDAQGFSKLPDVKNNTVYYEDGGRVFIKAIKNISAGSEVFVAYGRDYWKQAKENAAIDKMNNKKK